MSGHLITDYIGYRPEPKGNPPSERTTSDDCTATVRFHVKNFHDGMQRLIKEVSEENNVDVNNLYVDIEQIIKKCIIVGTSEK